jgi:glutamyl-tRNA synthetase
VGNVRTALFNALFALHAGQGQMLLRIEDTDRSRSYSEYTDSLIADLRWLGIPWTEGAGCSPEGSNGPYWQSERQSVYDQYYDQLIETGRAYPCFCSEEQLALARKLQRAAGKPPRYAGTCQHLSEAVIAEKRLQQIPENLRFRIPDKHVIEFIDLVKGKQHFSSDDIGDFIIRRADGTSPFMYSNAIDDALMGVTHALRGEDHLTNTPRQLLILEALGLRSPQYGHISLILGDDKLPLSKRNGSRSIVQLREEGYLPIAIVNYIARLGHYYESNALMDLTQLAEAFDLSHLSSSPARFELSQLQFWQKEALMQLSANDFWEWLPSGVKQQVPASDQTVFVQSIRSNVLFPKDALGWTECIYNEALTFDEPGQAVLRETSSQFFEEAIRAVNQQGTDYTAITEVLKQACDVKGKALFQPLRVALTGHLHGPELAPLLTLIGKDRAVSRFQAAKDYSRQ